MPCPEPRGITMRRRAFITLLGGAVAFWPLSTRAQQTATAARRIAVLLRVAKDDPDAQRDLQAFREELQKLGWMTGRTILIEYRYASGDAAQMQAYAAEMVRLPAEVVLASGSLAVAALQQETQSTPIVFVRVADPLSQGIVTSLAHPGGNVTGFASLEYTMSGKWLDLLKAIAPRLVRVSLMFNPTTAPYGPGFLRALETAAPSFGVKPTGALIYDPTEIEGIMSALGQDAGGLIVVPDAFTDVYREQIIALAASHRVPTIYGYRYFAAAGGLMSYGVSSANLFRRAATYVDRILKGEKPADLPVQQPTKFEFVINLKTAKALALTVPEGLLNAADEVLE
jgi:putative tryptophan/tyrosine transport system substrate-binding protein